MSTGDSGYCCLAGIMKSTVEEVYDYVDLVRLHREDVDQNRGPLNAIMLRLLAVIWNKSRKSEVTGVDLSEQIIFTDISKLWDDIPKDKVVQWPIRPSTLLDSVYRALNNNYALVVAIDEKGNNIDFNNLDHMVMIIGLADTPDGKTTLTLSCSIHGVWKCDADEFLSKHGGFDVIPFLVA
ncbi:hypothetical protein CCP1ISM_470001 [Azospirillaceae bacterium]